MINVPSYWPVPAAAHPITKTFNNGFREMIVAAKHGGGAWLEEWSNGTWNDTWHYYIDPARGVLEDYDYTPKSNPVMVPGKEIIWGNQQNVGDVIQGQCAIKGFAGFGVQYGWQKVSFNALHPNFTLGNVKFVDVLELEYWQYWTGYGAPGGMLSKGAKIWLATGVGFIKQIWETNGVPQPGAEVELLSISVA